MELLTPLQAAETRGQFQPERPGPLVGLHVIATGCGAIFADRWPDPRALLAETPTNYALAGEAGALRPADLARVAGFVDAPPAFAPLLREAFPQLQVWDRVILTLPGAPAEVRVSGAVVRQLAAEDAYHLWGLTPEMSWLPKTWGGPAGLAASGTAWGAFLEGRLVALACTFFVGERYEDIGLVADPQHRGRGFAAACSAGVCRDIIERGRTPSWTTSPDNLASLRVAEKLGFVHARDDVLYAAGIEIPAPARRS